MKKVLVTGLSGFIGSHISEFLLEHGYEIYGISAKKKADTEGISWHTVDLFDDEKVEECLKKVKPTHLVHLAWDVTHGEYLESKKNDKWVDASFNLFKSFKANGGERIVTAGTQLEYVGNSNYAFAKMEVLKLLETLGISYAEGRVYYLFGEGENPNRLIPYIIDCFLGGEKPNIKEGSKVIDLMYVKDVARAFVEILNADVQGIVDIALGKGIALKDLAESIGLFIENKEDNIQVKFKEFSSDDINVIMPNIYRLKSEVGFRVKADLGNEIYRIIKNKGRKSFYES